jgi:prepilin-type N-terminal cleavage/methylation domain-containing protein
MRIFLDKGEKGFTLIEVLVSMAVLVILMLALVRLFDEASGAYRKGTVSVSRNAAARAAMDMIARDFEGVVIDQRIRFYKEGDTVDPSSASVGGAGFDECCFITMEGDQDDGRSYQIMHYYVDIYTNVDAGMKYRGFRLMRGTVDLNVAKAHEIDALSLSKPFDWWKELTTPTNLWHRELVVDNIVRFDINVQGDKGDNIQTRNSGGWIAGQYAYSSDETARDKSGNIILAPNIPPLCVDVYLQITSDEAMKKGGANLLAVDDTLKLEGRSLLFRESSVLVMRIHPPMWAAQVAHPIPY